jgi:hypothetical protein
MANTSREPGGPRDTDVGLIISWPVITLWKEH